MNGRAYAGFEAQCPRHWGPVNAIGHRKVFDSWTCPKVKRSEEENSQSEQKIDARPAAETWHRRDVGGQGEKTDGASWPCCRGAMAPWGFVPVTLWPRGRTTCGDVVRLSKRAGTIVEGVTHPPLITPLIPSLATALIGTSVGPCCPSFQYLGQDGALLGSGRFWRALVRYAERWMHPTAQQRGDRRPWSRRAK